MQNARRLSFACFSLLYKIIFSLSIFTNISRLYIQHPFLTPILCNFNVDEKKICVISVSRAPVYIIVPSIVTSQSSFITFHSSAEFFKQFFFFFFRLRTGANSFVNRSTINCTPLMPRTVSPIDDQQLIGACENVQAAVAHVRRLANVPVVQVDANAQK